MLSVKKDYSTSWKILRNSDSITVFVVICHKEDVNILRHDSVVPKAISKLHEIVI